VHAIRCEVPVKNLGVPAKFIPQGDAAKILSAIGLDVDGIVATVRDVV
jgi:deoxyxylulose-5-phosphate synthase